MFCFYCQLTFKTKENRKYPLIFYLIWHAPNKPPPFKLPPTRYTLCCKIKTTTHFKTRPNFLSLSRLKFKKRTNKCDRINKHPRSGLEDITIGASGPLETPDIWTSSIPDLTVHLQVLQALRQTELLLYGQAQQLVQCFLFIFGGVQLLLQFVHLCHVLLASGGEHGTQT